MWCGRSRGKRMHATRRQLPSRVQFVPMARDQGAGLGVMVVDKHAWRGERAIGDDARRSAGRIVLGARAA